MKHNFDELLEQHAKQTGIKTLSAYDMEITRVVCDNGTPTMNITFKCDVNRRSGKTTRRILQAIIEASNGVEVIFFTRSFALSLENASKMREVLTSMNVKHRGFNETTFYIEGGATIECVSKHEYNSNTHPLKERDSDLIYIEDLD